MEIIGEYCIAAPRQAVWEALNDPEVLKECIPGCLELTRISESETEARIQAQFGPVRSIFATRITLRDLNPPTSYTLLGEGKSGAAGFGRGEVKLQLSEDGSGSTLLRYSATLTLSGRLAQIGSRLAEGATRKLADEFFSNVVTRLDQHAVKLEPLTVQTRAAPRHRFWLLAIAAALVLLAIWWLQTRR